MTSRFKKGGAPPPPPPPLTRDDLLAVLREMLTVEVCTKSDSSWDSKGYTITVNLLLDGETVASASDSIDVSVRDTSETWRSPFGD